MRITPSSTINLYANVDNESDERLIFSTRAKQIEYFLTKRVRQEVNCTVIRKSGVLRVEAPMSVVCNCNYISFINPSFDNKEFYGYITNYEYINNECTDISYQIDYWQSYMFDVTFQNMYIEREHLSQADFEKAETNPYDPSIFEFRTAETLPVSKNLEKLTYTVFDNDTYDGFKMSKALHSVVPAKDTMGALIKLSNIDFADLDSVNPDNSKAFAEYLINIVEGEQDSLGFFYLPREIGWYLQNKWGSLWPSGSTRTFVDPTLGDGWIAADNTPLNPFLSTKFIPNCFYIYDQCGADRAQRNGYMSGLIAILTQYKALDSIIDIKVVPDYFMILAGMTDTNAPIVFGQRTVKSKISVANKKLMRYPFSYMRVIAPNGDVKELQFERFSNVQLGEDICHIAATLDFSDQPTLIAAPVDYKMAISSNTIARANILEAILFNQFPSCPFTVDAFLAQVAAVANQTIGNRTLDAAWELSSEQTAVNNTSDIINTLKLGLGAGATGAGFGLDTDRDLNAIDGPRTYVSGVHGIGNLAQGVAKASEGYGYGSNIEARRGKFNAAAERWNEADNALSGSGANAISNQLALTKPAYACDKYYQSNGVGVTNFNDLSMMDLIILRVTLSPDILSVYDNWFSHYGYSSGRCGIPRAIQFARGASQDANLPHWVTLNGKETTYVKTMDCKVIHSMLPVASYIKSMFDSGVRLIKGDIATPQNGGN